MITSSQYVNIANLVSEIQSRGGLSMMPLLCVKNRLFEADINARERFRREFFCLVDATYAYLASHYGAPNPPMQDFVKALNQHILDFYGTETIDDFLVSENVTVPQTFADISAYVGYPITEVDS